MKFQIRDNLTVNQSVRDVETAVKLEEHSPLNMQPPDS